MKKVTLKRRQRDRQIAFLHRTKQSKKHKRIKSYSRSTKQWTDLQKWLDGKKSQGLDIRFENSRVTLSLPKVMNFSDHYEITILHLAAIRKLTERRGKSQKLYNLAYLSFDNLEKISTSAALVLTAEISKWDDALRRRLSHEIERWQPHIVRQLSDLGFFNLFTNNPFRKQKLNSNRYDGVKLVKYIKGKCGESDKPRLLKKEIIDIVGEEINKWTFLHGGLTEAITNVSHHAYPDNGNFTNKDKNWYLSGSYSPEEKLLKIVFFDQGIGIPRSLPASKVWEKVLVILSKVPMLDRKKDEVLLKAAVELNRSRTGGNDRGKGLQDLLEFINQRDNGYLSILSSKGLYKYSVIQGTKKTKSESFYGKLLGTLIIWSVSLEK